MQNRLQSLTDQEIERLHHATLDVLGRTGIVFNSEEALEIFTAHGFQVEGSKVFFTEAQVMKALETAPSEFTIRARNPEKSVRIGGDHFVLSPGWGAPFIMDASGTRRNATWKDSTDLTKLVQTSPFLDMTASSIVPAKDLPPETASAEQLAAAFTLTDMPMTGNPCCKANALIAMDMGAIVWGSREAASEAPFTIISVNPTSPLTYDPDAADGLITYARGGQALLISSMVMAGVSGPITLAGTAVMEMAESLAGIVLAQLVRPGTPCVCGGTSCAADLRFCSASIGSPELLKLLGIATQMAAYYGLPCRYGGGLSDAHFPDTQAGIESAMTIMAGLLSGVHYMHQACGILNAYTALSYEKFIMDEEIGGMLKRAMAPLDLSDEALALDAIHRIGSGGTYIMDPMTAKRCRTEFFIPDVAVRTSYEKWAAGDRDAFFENASNQVRKRLEAYVKPDIDPTIENDLRQYIHKGEFAA